MSTPLYTAPHFTEWFLVCRLFPYYGLGKVYRFFMTQGRYTVTVDRHFYVNVYFVFTRDGRQTGTSDIHKTRWSVPERLHYNHRWMASEFTFRDTILEMHIVE